MQHKYQFFNGVRFREECPGGYYINNRIGTDSNPNVRMHRYVWEYYNGLIPEGYDIHHIDGNKGNNDISNLQILSSADHKKYHSDNLSEEIREWRRQNLNEKARPAAIEWHKSEKGRSWHSEHIKQQHTDGVFKKNLICSYCGKSYIGEISGCSGNTFCSNACKSAYRRLRGIDNITKICPICNMAFETNKYRPKITCSRSCANKWKWRIRNESKIGNENN